MSKPKRPKPSQQPTPEPLPPSPPPSPVMAIVPDHPTFDFMTKEAKDKHAQLVRLLTEARMLCPTDATALIRYCHGWARWVEAAKFISEHGESFIIKDKTGKPVSFQPWPQTIDYHRLSSSLLRLEQELGLSPSARTRIRATANVLPPAPVLGHNALKEQFFREQARSYKING